LVVDYSPRSNNDVAVETEIRQDKDSNPKLVVHNSFAMLQVDCENPYGETFWLIRNLMPNHRICRELSMILALKLPRGMLV